MSKTKRRPASVKSPRVRWAKVKQFGSADAVVIGKSVYYWFDNEHEPREFVKTVNAELSRLVAARDKRRAR